MVDLGEFLREALGEPVAVLDLEQTEDLAAAPESADLDIDARWQGTGLEDQEALALGLLSVACIVRIGRRRGQEPARIQRGTVTGLGTDMVEATMDAFRQVAGVDPSKHDATWELTDLGARIQVWKDNGEHLIGELVCA
jgi:hypothetical protein